MKPKNTCFKVIAMLFLMGALVFNNNTAYGQCQCANDNILYLDITPPGPGLTNGVTCIYGGEYATVSVCEGASYTFSTGNDAGDFDTQISIYDDANPGLCLGGDDDFWGFPPGLSQLTWTANFSGVLRVLVDQYDCLPGVNNICMTLEATLNIANDVCANATPIGLGTTVGTTGCTTSDIAPSCGTTDGTGGGVWYTYVSTGNSLRVSTIGPGTNYDTKLRVYSGSCGALICEAGDDDSGGTLQSEVEFCTVPGATYYILVHGFSAQEGVFDLTLTEIINYPVISGCPTSFEVSNDAGECEADVNWTPPTATDECAGLTFVGTHSPIVTFPVSASSHVISYTATDVDGNTATCSFSVAVVDNEDPVVNCPADIDAPINLSLCGATVTYDVSKTDNCPGSTISQTAGLPAGSTFPAGITVNTFIASDAWGNSTNCTFEVRVLENILPTIICPGDMNLNTSAGDCSANNVSYFVFANDNCPGETLTQIAGLPPDSDFGLGTTVNTFVVEDASGNKDTCSFSVTVTDAENPTIDCPANINVNNDAGQCGAIVNYTVNSSDNCAGSNQVQTGGSASGAFYPVGTTTNTWQVTDAAGLTASCSFDVTVADTEPPVVTCPANITVSNDAGVCGAIVSFNPTATDNCPGVIIGQTAGPSPASLFPIGATGISYEATDVAGNATTCIFTVTVNDNEDPVITCPSDISVDNDPGQCGAVVNFSVSETDNCPGVSTNQTGGLASGSFFPIDASLLTFEATDASGNTAECSFNVTVNDAEDPVVTCPANISVSNDSGICGAVVSFNASAVDNCPGVTFDQIGGLPTGSTFPVGVTLNTYLAQDGEALDDTCTFTVTVIDDEDPIISCIDDTTLINDPGQCSSIVDYGIDVSDNCDIDSVGLVIGLGSGSAFPVGKVSNTWVVFDNHGNVATCTFTVTVDDEEPPVITCPADIQADNDPGLCSAIVNYVVTSTDNCPGDTVVQVGGLASGSAFPVGITTNTFIAIDAAGNSDTCSFDVEVDDVQDPVITCPASVTVPNDPGLCSAVVNYNVTSTDNCTGETIAQIGGLSSGSAFPVGQTVNTFTATDTTGNSANCSFIIRVKDNEGPELICPGDILVIADSNDCDPQVFWTSPTPTDNCNEFDTIFCSNEPGDEFPVATKIVSYTAIDIEGNVSTCQFNITVQPKPLVVTSLTTITYLGGTNVSCNGGVDGEATVTAAGGCLPYSYEWSNGTFDQTATGLSAGTHTVTVIDAQGSKAPMSITLTEPDALEIDAGPNQTLFLIVPGSECSQLSSTIIGGTPGYDVLWSTGETTETIDICVDQDTTFYVTVTDTNGCTHTDSVKVCFINARCDDNGNQIKVLVCHFPPNNPDNSRTVCISINAILSHLGHGDQLGPCQEQEACQFEEDGSHKTSSDKLEYLIRDYLQEKPYVNAFPNPFTNSTKIRFALPESGRASIHIYDITGAEVEKLFDEEVEGGKTYESIFRAENRPGGMYFYRLVTKDGAVFQGKLILAN